MSKSTDAAASSGTCGAMLYDTPVRDIACAMPYSDTATKAMKKCCKDADVVGYYDNCGVYCLALGQSAEELTDCLLDNGAKDGEVFCRDGNHASATATGADPDPSADTTVIQEGKGGKGGKDGDDGDSDSDSDDDEDAAALTRPSHTTVAGVVIGTLLFTATAFGGIII